MPASGDIAEPPMPIMWMCLDLARATFLFSSVNHQYRLKPLRRVLIRNGWFQDFERAFSFGVQFGSNTKGYRQHGSLRVTHGSAVNDGHTQWRQNLRANFRDDRTSAGGWVAVREVAQKDSRHSLKNSGLPQMAQGAIHLIRLHAAILEEKNRPFGVWLEARTQRGLQHGEATAQNAAGGRAGNQRLAAKRDRPFFLRLADGLKEGHQIVARGTVRPMVETRGNHRPIEPGPAARFGHQQLQNVQIAVAHDAFGNAQPGEQ